MAFKYPDSKGLKEPLKTLIEGNADTYSQLYSVIESFKDKNLKFSHPSIKTRTIAEILNHTLDCQLCFYLNSLILNGKYDCVCKVPGTIKEALKSIQGTHDKVAGIIKKIKLEELDKEIKTEWGQVMIKKVAIFQSITQLMYHISEICFLAGVGGFYRGTLG